MGLPDEYTLGQLKEHIAGGGYLRILAKCKSKPYTGVVFIVSGIKQDAAVNYQDASVSFGFFLSNDMGDLTLGRPKSDILQLRKASQLDLDLCYLAGLYGRRLGTLFTAQPDTTYVSSAIFNNTEFESSVVLGESTDVERTE